MIAKTTLAASGLDVDLVLYESAGSFITNPRGDHRFTLTVEVAEALRDHLSAFLHDNGIDRVDDDAMEEIDLAERKARKAAKRLRRANR